MSYKGYKNYQTWLINSWINNDEVFHKDMLEAMYEFKTVDGLADYIKDYIRIMVYDFVSHEFLKDLLHSILEDVDYRAISNEFFVNHGVFSEPKTIEA